jgi:hypothetical protein
MSCALSRTAKGELCGLRGSTFPFRDFRREREEVGDPRLSMHERYPTGEARKRAVADAAAELIRRGFLLDEDSPAVQRAALAPNGIPK